jgi:tRNA threonylcarbamoyladenosine biosynthesis protein TsaE
MPRTIDTSTEEETIALGESFARALRPGDVVALFGTLGTGKTRFIKGVCRGLGVAAHVTSPTFTIVNQYQGSTGVVYHFDFYRLKSQNELREIGFEEYLSSGGICLVEWAEQVEGFLPSRRFNVRLAHGAEGERRRIVIEEPAGVMA